MKHRTHRGSLPKGWCRKEKEYRTKYHAYYSYQAMMQRCYAKYQKSYSRNLKYQRDGIQVCLRWCGPEGFQNFVQDMGERPEGATLDRINNDGHYTPDNCRWSYENVRHGGKGRA